MSENTIKYVTKQIEAFLCTKMPAQDAPAMANKIVAAIDWNNSALMHKDLRWIASAYLDELSA